MSRTDTLSCRGGGRMDDAFEFFFGAGRGRSQPFGMQPDLGWHPAADVYETKEEFIIQMDLAGMKRNEIEVTIEDDFVRVRGERTNIAPPGKKHFHKMEIQIGPFERHIQVPDTVDLSSASASYRSGFLFIHLRRGNLSPSPRRSIPVEQKD